MVAAVGSPQGLDNAIALGVVRALARQPDPDLPMVYIGSAHTRITRAYSFKLKEDVFPGGFGALGRWLFRVGFLDRDYAAMMRECGRKTIAEAQPNDAQSRP
jgi:hypothetical protein